MAAVCWDRRCSPCRTGGLPATSSSVSRKWSCPYPVPVWRYIGCWRDLCCEDWVLVRAGFWSGLLGSQSRLTPPLPPLLLEAAPPLIPPKAFAQPQVSWRGLCGMEAPGYPHLCHEEPGLACNVVDPHSVMWKLNVSPEKLLGFPDLHVGFPSFLPSVSLHLVRPPLLFSSAFYSLLRHLSHSFPVIL